MGVERWLYQRLNRPDIKISGEVQANLHVEEKIDWINQSIGGTLLFAEEASDLPSILQDKIVQTLIPEIRLRGGCELDALSHYFSQEASKMVADNNYVNGGFMVRQDSTTNMALSFAQEDQAIQQEIDQLGLRQGFNHVFASLPSGTLFIASFWGDAYLLNYTHKTLGFNVNVALRAPGLPNLISASPQQVEEFLKDKHHAAQDAADHLNRMVYFNIYKDIMLFYSELLKNKAPVAC